MKRGCSPHREITYTMWTNTYIHYTKSRSDYELNYLLYIPAISFESTHGFHNLDIVDSWNERRWSVVRTRRAQISENIFKNTYTNITNSYHSTMYCYIVRAKTKCQTSIFARKNIKYKSLTECTPYAYALLYITSYYTLYYILYLCDEIFYKIA